MDLGAFVALDWKAEVERLVIEKGVGIEYESSPDWMGMCQELSDLCRTEERREFAESRVSEMLGAECVEPLRTWWKG